MWYLCVSDPSVNVERITVSSRSRCSDWGCVKGARPSDLLPSKHTWNRCRKEQWLRRMCPSAVELLYRLQMTHSRDRDKSQQPGCLTHHYSLYPPHLPKWGMVLFSLLWCIKLLNQFVNDLLGHPVLDKHGSEGKWS